MPEAVKRGVWGVVATPFAGSDAELDLASLERLVSQFAAIVAFLASAQASYLPGTNVRVGGGMIAGVTC